jgi:hypothetical protein
MKKMQILFPEPQLERLRKVAKRVDKPVSEIVRRATEEFLDRLPPSLVQHADLELPVFNGGRTLVPPERFRESAYGERTGERAMEDA